MAAEPLRTLIGLLRRSAGPEGAEPTDGELLRRFSERRDEDAFSALVGRHGPLVFGVCRRMLGDHHHAEDAFQACFLVLAGRAPRLVGASSVAGWLHEVAVRVGRKARARAERAVRRDREAGARRPEVSPSREAEGLDEELNRLPAAYRDALALCYLQGRSAEEAAALLGCSPDALRGRLHRGKQLLRDRLRHDPPALLPVPPPAGLHETTLAALSAPGPAALTLARGVIGSMFLMRMIWPLAALVFLGVGVPLALWAGGEKPTPREQPPKTEKPKGETPRTEKPRDEKPKEGKGKAGDPEPPAAVQVRELKLKATPPELWGGNQVRVFTKASAVSELGGREASAEMKAARKELAEKVKFGREVLVLVNYETGGPPYGELKYKIDAKKREVEFYCREPKIGLNQARGDALKLGAEFFVVPAGTKVKWGGLK